MSRTTLLFACLFSLILSPALPVQAQEAPEEETVEVLEFLEEKDEGNLAVDPGSMKPEAYALYARAHFFFKNYEKGRNFWGNTAEAESHSHETTLNGAGNGVTSMVNGHHHDVKAGVLLPAAGGGASPRGNTPTRWRPPTTVRWGT